MKKLYRSTTNKVISGVCGGIAEYFNIDPILIRIIWALFTFFSAGIAGFIAYVICAIIIPYPPRIIDDTTSEWRN